MLTRIDAYPGPQATAIAAANAPNGFAVGTFAGTAIADGNLIISGNLGIGTATPTFSLQLATDSAGKPGATGLWTINSDVRIKQNIADIPNALSAIRKLQPRQFQFHPAYAKDIQADPNATYYGFIADEVEKIIDGCVSSAQIHCYGCARPDPQAQPLPDLMNLKTFNIHNILIYSVAAVKELADRADVLQKQIDDL